MNIQASHTLRFEAEGVVIEALAELVTPSIAAALGRGAYEAEEARIVRRALAPGDRVLEIGAGLGFVTCLIARDPRVEALVSVEADARLARQAARTLAANGLGADAEILHGMFDHDAEAGAEAVFYQRPDFWMSSRLATDVPHARETRVPVLSLNRMLRARRITCIVCDIEGAEVELFAGADLSGVDRVMVEVHDHVTGLSGVARLFDCLARAGFCYDPRCAEGSVILFRRLGGCPDRRPYGAA